MSRRDHSAGLVRLQQPMDRLWLVAFPIFFGFTFGYGLFASLHSIVALRPPDAPDTAAVPADATGAQLFGVLVAVASAIGLVGALVTIFRRHDGLELFGSGFFVLMMLVYFAALTYLIGEHDPNTRPGSSFVPTCMGVFPAIRCAVIYRDRKQRRKRAAAEGDA